MDSVKIYNFRGRGIGTIVCEDCNDILRFARESNIRVLYLQPMCVGVKNGIKVYSDKFDMLQMSHSALKEFYFLNNFAKEHFKVIIYP